jgi:ATP-dependent helicase/DNAse subunit B
MRRFKEINIILTGGVDDIWQDTRDGKLIVVDYKSQASNKPLDAHTYLTDA